MPFLVPVDVSPRVRTALSDFVPDEGNFTPPYFRIASEIHEIWRKIGKRDVREEMRRQALNNRGRSTDRIFPPVTFPGRSGC